MSDDEYGQTRERLELLAPGAVERIAADLARHVDEQAVKEVYAEMGFTPKPLHVRVAEALGSDVIWADAGHELTERFGVPTWWRRLQPGETHHVSSWFFHVVGPVGSERPKECPASGCWTRDIPECDTDWSATGPEIGRLKIRLSYSSQGRPFADHPSVDAEEQRDDERDILPAVCRLILALAEAGKLPK